MNFGTGGANVSFDNLHSAFIGLQAWAVTSQVNRYGRQNELALEDLVFLRAQYGYGDDVQIGQLWDILRGDTILNLNADGDFFAQTITDENGRVVHLSAFQQGMSREEQFLLATILGHEAYRDGFGVGQVDAFGNEVTWASNFAEHQAASIARIMMGDRINAEHDWFFNTFGWLGNESRLLADANALGDFSLFDTYLALNYRFDEDYFFLRAMTGGDYQNTNRDYRDIPLFDARFRSRDEVNALNDVLREEAFQRYMSNYTEENEHLAMSWDDFRQNDAFQRAHGFIPEPFISLGGFGCRLFTAKYMLEALHGRHFPADQLHNFAHTNEFFSSPSNMSRENMVDLINAQSSGSIFNIAMEFYGLPTPQRLWELNQSENMYMATLMVPGVNGGVHFVVVDRIDFSIHPVTQEPMVQRVHVANPWSEDGSVLGQQSYTPSQILRWDIFNVTASPNNLSEFMAWMDIRRLEMNGPWR
jgi:hypothetical protein